MKTTLKTFNKSQISIVDNFLIRIATSKQIDCRIITHYSWTLLASETPICKEPSGYYPLLPYTFIDLKTNNSDISCGPRFFCLWNRPFKIFICTTTTRVTLLNFFLSAFRVKRTKIQLSTRIPKHT